MTERIRGRAWMQIRARILRRDGGMCQYCLRRDGSITVATEVDHRIALHNDGSNDDENLVATCHECHEAKTRQDLGQRERVTIGLDGWPAEG